MIPHRNNLFCIVVHFGAQQPTNRLIRQLNAGRSHPTGILIINNSPDSYAPPESVTPLRVVNSVDNLGYAGGINRGFKELKNNGLNPSDIVLCCNNDISIEPHTVERIMDWWQQQKQPLLAAAVVGTLNLATGRAVLKNVTLFDRLCGMPYAHGSCLVASLAAWQKVGPLPERYFMYWEDVAFSQQAHTKGVAIKQLPDVGISHSDAKQALSDEKLYVLVRNGASFLETKTSLLWRVYWKVMNVLRTAYHSVLHHTVITRALADRYKV